MSEAEQTAPDTPAPDAAETEARAKGWVPKEEYKGKRDWKPADEWLADGDEITQLRKELKKTQDAFIDYGRQNREAALKQAREERERELDNAVEAGDKDAARKAAAELKKVDKQEAVDIPRPAQAFIDSNKEWFGFHEKATDYARGRERKLLADGVSLEDVYDAIAGDVKKKFPELFDDTVRDKPSSVDAGGAPRTGRRNKGHGLHVGDLPEMYQKIAKDFIKRGVITEEKYIQDLIDTGAVSIK